MSGVRVFVAVGSNLGDAVGNVQRAVETLGLSPSVTVLKESSLYESPPWGVEGRATDQPDFINSACIIETTLTARDLLDLLKSIETAFGREDAGLSSASSGDSSNVRWGPRVLDLDIIFYGDEIIEEVKLTVPHPRAHERAFVMMPLAEIGADFTHPVLKKTVGEIAAAFEGGGGCRKVDG